MEARFENVPELMVWLLIVYNFHKIPSASTRMTMMLASKLGTLPRVVWYHILLSILPGKRIRQRSHLMEDISYLLNKRFSYGAWSQTKWSLI